MRPWTRLAMSLALCLGVAQASPLYPDIHRLVREAQAAPAQFAPARAGWNGPEMPRKTAPSEFDSAMVLRANKAAILSAAIPDARAIFSVVLVIFLMRLLMRVQEEQKRRRAGVISIDTASQERRAA